MVSRLLQGYAMRVYCLVSEFVLPGIAESSTIYVTCDLVLFSAHVRKQVHFWRYTTPLLIFWRLDNNILINKLLYKSNSIYHLRENAKFELIQAIISEKKIFRKKTNFTLIKRFLY